MGTKTRNKHSSRACGPRGKKVKGTKKNKLKKGEKSFSVHSKKEPESTVMSRQIQKDKIDWVQKENKPSETTPTKAYGGIGFMIDVPIKLTPQKGKGHRIYGALTKKKMVKDSKIPQGKRKHGKPDRQSSIRKNGDNETDQETSVEKKREPSPTRKLKREGAATD